jgi:hypothetical protein
MLIPAKGNLNALLFFSDKKTPLSKCFCWFLQDFLNCLIPGEALTLPTGRARALAAVVESTSKKRR